MRVVVIGAGGHARSVLEAMRDGPLEPAACTDPHPALHGMLLDGVPVVGGDELLPDLLRDGISGAVVALGAVGDNTARARVFDEITAIGFALPVVRSRAARVATTARLGAGSVILAGASVGAAAQIGRNVLINTGAIVEHGCVIGDHAHIASGATLGGDVVVEERAHVGLGAVVCQGLRIGAAALVGAGAVAVRDVRAGACVIGVPARERTPIA